MKTLVTTLLALVSSLAIAQKHSSISRNINDDGKTLSIRVNGTVDGKSIDYDRSFDVSDMNQDERNALREHILDSLNVGMPEPPKPPTAPRVTLRTPAVPKPPRSPHVYNGNSTVIITDGDNPMVYASGSGDERQVTAVSGKNPYTKEVKYNSETGQLYVRYRFQKDGEEVNYERTINTQDKSQKDRQRIVEGIEKEIGVPVSSK
jgi:hypothetical protein